MKQENSLYQLGTKHLAKRRQFILYTLIGLSGVCIDYVAFALGVEVFGFGILLANFISISLGIINNFALNTRYNFKVSDMLLLRFSFFYGIGFLGLILSELLLILFHYGFGVGPLLAKLLTLPFILVSQYILNKYISFGSLDKSVHVLKRIIFHWPAYIVGIIFLIMALLFLKQIPANFNATGPTYAPDEVMHYTYNVKFIKDNKQLPISGKDDLPAYTQCRDNYNGAVSCLYSYTFYPGSSYVVSALSASILPKVIHISPQKASRVPSVLYGLIFTFCAYFLAYLITKRRFVATLLTIGVALIPQVIFTSSYTNLDAYSLAISGLLGLSLANFLKNPQRRFSIFLLAVSFGGLLPLAKYNYFVLALPIIALMLYSFATKRITSKQLWSFVLMSVCSFLVLASFWYIRNALLYHDPLGQNFALQEMSRHHTLGQSRPFTFSSIVYLNDINFFHILFRSFYLGLGGMIFFLEDYKYIIPGSLSILIILQLFSRIFSGGAKLKPLLFTTLGYLLLLLLVIAQVVYNSLQFDFQPQGRYLYPILIPTVLLLAYAAKVDKDLERLTILLATGTLFILICSFDVIMKVYL